MNSREECPVCKREVDVTPKRRLVWPHNHTASGRCPMSNHELPQSIWSAA